MCFPPFVMQRSKRDSDEYDALTPHFRQFEHIHL